MRYNTGEAHGACVTIIESALLKLGEGYDDDVVFDAIHCGLSRFGAYYADDDPEEGEITADPRTIACACIWHAGRLAFYPPPPASVILNIAKNTASLPKATFGLHELQIADELVVCRLGAAFTAVDHATVVMDVAAEKGLLDSLLHDERGTGPDRARRARDMALDIPRRPDLFSIDARTLAIGILAEATRG